MIGYLLCLFLFHYGTKDFSKDPIYTGKKVPYDLDAYIGQTVSECFSGENLVNLLIQLFSENLWYLIFIEHNYDDSKHVTGTRFSFSPQLILP